MKQDLHPKWYKPRCSPPSPWKVVLHHQGLCPLLFKNSSVGFLHPKRIRTVEELWHATYGFSSLSERLRKSNDLQMSQQRQRILPSYFLDPEHWTERMSEWITHYHQLTINSMKGGNIWQLSLMTHQPPETLTWEVPIKRHSTVYCKLSLISLPSYGPPSTGEQINTSDYKLPPNVLICSPVDRGP